MISELRRLQLIPPRSQTLDLRVSVILPHSCLGTVILRGCANGIQIAVSFTRLPVTLRSSGASVVTYGRWSGKSGSLSTLPQFSPFDAATSSPVGKYSSPAK